MINLIKVKRALAILGFAGFTTVLAASSAAAFSGMGGGHFGGGGFGGGHFGGAGFSGSHYSGGGRFGGNGLGGSHISYGHPGRGDLNGGTHHPTRGPIYGGNHRTPGHCEGERCGGRKPPQVGSHCWRDHGCKIPVRCEWSHSCRVPVTCRYNRFAYGCHWRPKYPPVIVQRPYNPTPTYTAAPTYTPAPSYTPAPAAYTPTTKVCTPTGTYLSIVFQDNASVADVTGFLKNYNVTMGDGPNADGVYRIKLPDGGTQEQIGQMIDSMRGQTNIVKSVG